MKLGRSYNEPSPNEATNALAQKITALVVDSAVTYGEAIAALKAAAERLETQTRPVNL